ncbi:hypothetical protein EVAR_78595_1 [Eumeta japonica]|uniref:Uncharacterized protein n=1 Tax=Eumeta variegata TaxID=151549 RepID=A0A4C1U7V8_EUMVA|nr:hypothetical protein EVAR_78595_1 [Eumeta japonica]
MSAPPVLTPWPFASGAARGLVHAKLHPRSGWTTQLPARNETYQTSAADNLNHLMSIISIIDTNELAKKFRAPANPTEKLICLIEHSSLVDAIKIINFNSPKVISLTSNTGSETRKTMPCNHDTGARLVLCTFSGEDWTLFKNVQYVLDLIRGASAGRHRDSREDPVRLFHPGKEALGYFTSASLGVSLLSLVQARCPDRFFGVRQRKMIVIRCCLLFEGGVPGKLVSTLRGHPLSLNGMLLSLDVQIGLTCVGVSAVTSYRLPMSRAVSISRGLAVFDETVKQS